MRSFHMRLHGLVILFVFRALTGWVESWICAIAEFYFLFSVFAGTGIGQRVQ